HRSEYRSYFNRQAQFFLDFSFQAIVFAFSDFNLAAGEFPFKRKFHSLGSLADQDFIIVFYDGTGYVKHRVKINKLIISLSLDTVAYPAAGILHVAFISWYHMAMKVKDCLPGGLTTVHADVEAVGIMILFNYRFRQ